jgi:hypothetical protein
VRRTIYLPDELDERVDRYLREHPGLSFSSLVQEALDGRLAPPDPRKILDLAGLVGSASTTAGSRAEDRHVRQER